MVFFPILKDLFFPIYSPYEPLIQLHFPSWKIPYANWMSIPMTNAKMKLPLFKWIAVTKTSWQWLLKGFHCPPKPNLFPNSQVTNSLSLPLAIKYPNSLFPKASNGQSKSYKKQNMLLKDMQNEMSCLLFVHKWCSSYAHDILPSIMKIVIVLSLDFKVSLNKY